MKKLWLLCMCCCLAGPSDAQHLSWFEAKSSKKAVLKVYYVENPPFVFEKDGKLQGIEYELLERFVHFLNYKYQITLTLDFQASPHQEAARQSLLRDYNGTIAIGGFAKERFSTNTLSFSRAYLPDIQVLISGNGLKVAQNISDFREIFAQAKALTSHSASQEEALIALKRYLPSLLVEQVQQEKQVLAQLREGNYFTFASIIQYFYWHHQGIHLTRQKLFQRENGGLAFALTPRSDWQVPLDIFLSDRGTQSEISQIVYHYLGEEVHELLLDLKGKDMVKKEIELLTLERSLQQKDMEKQSAALSQKTLLSNILLAASAILVVSASVLYYRYHFKQKANALIEEKSHKIEIQKNELLEKTRLLDELNRSLKVQNQQVKESIQAAKSIQEAILPFGYRFDTVREYGILYLPKDIVVSGDFYWTTQAEHRTFIAVADCTGHGVPGALMSMLGATLLNEIVNIQGVYATNTILELLHIGVKKALKQDHLNNRHGMDIALVRIDKKWNDEWEVSFSGANRPLYAIQQGQLHKLKGDRATIGGWQSGGEYSAFNSQSLLLKAQALLYLGSDGFVDMPNPRREKFGSKRFEEMLLRFYELPASEQIAAFEQELRAFQQEAEQRDDIALLCVRL